MSPTADELAAIAAAYLLYLQRSAGTASPPQAASGWAFAARVEPAAGDVRIARFLAAAPARWSAAGRLDG